MTTRKWSRRFGPGFLVTAAFIGPGTVTTACVAGDTFGFALWWTIPFAVFVACVLQDMAARLGLVTGQGLGDALRHISKRPTVRWGTIVLVLSAILIGNAAYQAGNLTGAAVGLETLTGLPKRSGVILSGLLALGVLWLGVYRSLQTALITIVALMSVMFITAAVSSAPSPMAVMRATDYPSGSLTLVIALIGTTVVPYNLFLHANAALAKWGKDGDGSAKIEERLRAARWDTILAIGLGGAVTLAILVTAAMNIHGRGLTVNHPAETAQHLGTIFGGHQLFSLGLFAAGLTSSITAPLAAAYATCGCLGWSTDLKAPAMRSIVLTVILVGVCIAMIGSSPQALILFAQTANGLLLPIVAWFLLISMKRVAMLGPQRIGPWQNAIGGMAVLSVTALAGWKLWQLVTP